MATVSRLSKLAVAVAVVATAAGGSIILQHSLSSNDRGTSDQALESYRSKINDPTAVVPRRSVQESALIGASSLNPLDILVIGGGATGCGVALDAVTRGLRVGLVEREDFGSGTSSRSTKLIHGGIVNLKNLKFCCCSFVQILDTNGPNVDLGLRFIPFLS